MQSWSKEIKTLESQPLSSKFNYKVWFEEGSENNAFCYAIPPNPAAALHIRRILTRWRSQCAQRLHFPRMSNKSIAQSTVRHWEALEKTDWNQGQMGEFTQLTVERYYHETGVQLEGECEIRQKWYRSGVSPRTYYAQGGTAYAKSKWVQGIFSDLVDSFICTEHSSRLNPTRIVLDDDEYLRIYDLSSFTSNHHESKHFLRALAEFCRGHTIDVVDAFEGILTLDLGELLSDYSTMNDIPQYSMERIHSYYTSTVHHQNVAGFLGVYGNLMSSTFLHGASMFQVVDEEDKLNIAGDDGHFAEVAGMEDRTTPIIRGNGVVAMEKEFATYENGAVCLKRGIVQFGPRLIQKSMIIWPSISLTLEKMGIPSRHHTNTGLTKRELKEVVASDMMRFLRSIFSAGRIEDAEYVVTYCNNFFDQTGLPKDGSVPQLGGHFLCPICPKTIDQLYTDPLRSVLGLHYGGGVVLPLRVPSHTVDAPEINWSIDSEFEGLMTSQLSYLESLGYLMSTSIPVLYGGMDGFSRLLKEFDLPERKMYTFRVLKVPRDLFQYDD